MITAYCSGPWVHAEDDGGYTPCEVRYAVVTGVLSNEQLAWELATSTHPAWQQALTKLWLPHPEMQSNTNLRLLRAYCAAWGERQRCEGIANGPALRQHLAATCLESLHARLKLVGQRLCQSQEALKHCTLEAYHAQKLDEANALYREFQLGDADNNGDDPVGLDPYDAEEVLNNLMEALCGLPHALGRQRNVCASAWLQSAFIRDGAQYDLKYQPAQAYWRI